MTWTINLNGHDDLRGEAKVEFEKGLVGKVDDLVRELRETEGCVVTTVMVMTNTTGAVNMI